MVVKSLAMKALVLAERLRKGGGCLQPFIKSCYAKPLPDI